MSKKKHPEHVNHERWLVSYADFITLLFAFFVVLFASGQSDKKRQSEMATAMQTAFNPSAIFSMHAKQPTVVENMGSQTAPINTAIMAQMSQTAHQIETSIHNALAQMANSDSLPVGSVSVHTTKEGIVVSLQEAGFFPSGSAEVRTASLPVLSAIAASLPRSPMRIEGHTDNVPIHNALFATNWELSAARASTIARFLIDHGNVDPHQLAATGYSEFHPVATNATEEGRARNRRVDLVLLSH